MSRYYVNNIRQSNGDHEVHVEGCSWLQLATSTRDLGEHLTCITAVAAARRIYPSANGCAYCAPTCHTR